MVFRLDVHVVVVGELCHISKMAAGRTNTRLRFSVKYVVAEVQNDSDSGDDDLYSNSEISNEEIDSDYQNLTPLLPVVLDALT